MKIKKMFFVIIAVVIVIGVFCFITGGKGIYSVKFGSNLNSSGEINEKSLLFNFEYNGNKNIEKLFNHIYFEGDTLCFSFKIETNVNKDRVKVFFINPKNGDIFKAERIDMDGKRISGFSLIGTILEQFYFSKFSEKISLEKFRKIEIPFIVRVEVELDNKILVNEKKDILKLIVNY